MSTGSLFDQYKFIHSKYLVPIAQKLNTHLTEHLAGTPRIDRIYARAKEPGRFVVKATKIVDGQPKYSNPMREIQDQIGARIITYYLDDVDGVTSRVNEYYQSIEQRLLIPESESEFGYVGKHFILRLPEDVFDDDAPRDSLPIFFELQIKTLFQHAWSEANHDLAYKAEETLTTLQKRQVAFTAAQAWGADQVFNTLHNELIKL